MTQILTKLKNAKMRDFWGQDDIVLQNNNQKSVKKANSHLSDSNY